MTHTATLTASQREAVYNIGRLAASGYQHETRNVTRRADAVFSQIAIINHQEVGDREIANALTDIHHCPGLRLERIERRALQLLGVR
jgi:hypothetical protein